MASNWPQTQALSQTDVYTTYLAELSTKRVEKYFLCTRKTAKDFRGIVANSCLLTPEQEAGHGDHYEAQGEGTRLLLSRRGETR
ncbi:MAG: hypothetical protein M0Z36_08200, partial [Thermaerobacter sp.]|nr:hypothetical protein [Thermaerobacter sp.]